MSERKKNIFSDKKIVSRAIKDSFLKLNPRTQVKNPVMFMVFVSAILPLAMFGFALAGVRDADPGYILAISVILWFTVLFGNFAEAIAEGRGKAQADALRAGRRDTMASRIPSPGQKDKITQVKSTELKKGDVVYVKDLEWPGCGPDARREADRCKEGPKWKRNGTAGLTRSFCSGRISRTAITKAGEN